MANKEQRGNREKRKPKKEKPKSSSFSAQALSPPPVRRAPASRDRTPTPIQADVMRLLNCQREHT